MGQALLSFPLAFDDAALDRCFSAACYLLDPASYSARLLGLKLSGGQRRRRERGLDLHVAHGASFFLLLAILTKIAPAKIVPYYRQFEGHLWSKSHQTRP